MDALDEFWTIANEAIKKGLITKDDALLICRGKKDKQGNPHRKNPYWAAHLARLKKIIEEREKRLHENT